MKEILIERFVEANTGFCKVYEIIGREKVLLERIFCEDSAWDYAERLIRKSGDVGGIRYRIVRHRCCKNCKHYREGNWFNKCGLHKEYSCDNRGESWCRDYELKSGVTNDKP